MTSTPLPPETLTIHGWDPAEVLASGTTDTGRLWVTTQDDALGEVRVEFDADGAALAEAVVREVMSAPAQAERAAA